jgi:hypothetical protein
VRSTRCSRQILIELEFSRQFFEKNLSIKFHQNRPVGAELFPAAGQRGQVKNMTKLRVAFRNFEKVPKNRQHWLID